MSSSSTTSAVGFAFIFGCPSACARSESCAKTGDFCRRKGAPTSARLPFRTDENAQLAIFRPKIDDFVCKSSPKACFSRCFRQYGRRAESLRSTHGYPNVQVATDRTHCDLHRTFQARRQERHGDAARRRSQGTEE